MTRVVNRSKEAYDVYIGRGSKWGNPYTHMNIAFTKASFLVHTRREAIEAYEFKHLSAHPELLAMIPELEGKVLGCYCAPKSCHGDVLVRLVELWKRLGRPLTAEDIVPPKQESLF